jgi:hypothetical protein
MTLTPVKDRLHSRSRIEYHSVNYTDIPGDTAQGHPEKSKEETQSGFEDRLHDSRKRAKVPIQPEPGQFAPMAIPLQLSNELSPEEMNKHRVEDQMNLKKDYAERGLQVIVRIADVTPTPEQPVFETAWHVEGQLVCSYTLGSSIRKRSNSNQLINILERTHMRISVLLF